MQKNHHIVRLGSRIKLFKRHMLEWSILLILQKQVRFLTKEHMQQKAKLLIKDTTTIDVIRQLANQVLRLAQVSERHSGERQAMKARHELEDFALEQAIDSHL